MKNSATAEVEIDEIEIRSKKSLNPVPNNIRKKSKIKKMIKENIVCTLFVLPAVAIYTFFYISSVVKSLYLSFVKLIKLLCSRMSITID